jgi:hypothetical protein
MGKAKNRKQSHRVPPPSAAPAEVPETHDTLASEMAASGTPPSEKPAPETSAAEPRPEAEATLPWLAGAPRLLAVLYLAVFLFVVAQRLRYPFALEWIEAGLLGEVRWLLAGHNLYVPPSIDFVPFVYNPLYFWVCGAVSKVLGASLFTLRLVSAASSLGTFGLLYALVVRETKSRAAGIVGAGLYAAAFKRTEQFMDVARVDALFVLLLVATVWVLRTRPTARGRALAAGLLVLCFLAKQTGVIFAAPLLLFLVRDAARGAEPGGSRGALGPWSGVPYALAVPLGVGVSVWLLNATSGGWYRFYAFGLTTFHPLVRSMWTDYWTLDVLGPLGCAVVGALFVIFGPSGVARRERELWGAVLVGALLTSWSGRLHDGGWSNVLMPAYAILSVLFAVALHAAMTAARRTAPDVRRGLEVFLSLVGVVQLAMFAYDPSTVVPTGRDEAAGWKVVEALRAAPGDTFTPTDSYLSLMAGKPPHLHEMAADDIFSGPPGDVQTKLREDVHEAFRQRRWAMVITDNDWFADDVLQSYQRGPESVSDPSALYPRSGVQYRPGWIYTPR